MSLQFWVLCTEGGIHVKLCYCIFKNRYNFFLSLVTSNGFQVFLVEISCLFKGTRQLCCQFNVTCILLENENCSV